MGVYSNSSYQNRKLYVCKFVNTGYEVLSTGGNIKKHQLKDCLYPTVYGIGMIGYVENPQLHTQYERWIRMIQRCYDKVYQNKEPSYKGVIVDERWHRFDYFIEDVPSIKWYNELVKYQNIVVFEIDKDVFALDDENKIYNLNQCCFIPKEINNLFRRKPITNTSGYMGVSYYKKLNKYKASLGQKYLGVFDSAKEAFDVYHKTKIKELYNLLDKYNFLSPSIKQACIQKMNKGYVDF